MPRKGSVDEFLAKATPPKAGGVCKTCLHPKREQIEADATTFNERRTSGQTVVTWEYFTKSFMHEAHGYGFDYRALIRHLEKCCGIEVN